MNNFGSKRKEKYADEGRMSVWVESEQDGGNPG